MDVSAFDSAVERLQKELTNLHANRANPALVEEVMVEAYGSPMRLMEVASISVPEPQQLSIQPWDKSLLKDIDHALRTCEQQFNPVVDGEMIRISFPPLTEEKRKELVKVMHGKIEDGRIAVRKVREEILKKLKQDEKDGNMSEDEYFRKEKEVQETVDQYNAKLKELGEKKEAELMTI